MSTSIDEDASSIYCFKPPRLRLSLAIGRKRRAWYLIFAKHYPTADEREVVRLDIPGTYVEDYRFWFDDKTVTGWEPHGENLLQYLLSMSPKQPAIFSLISNNNGLDRPNEVALLVPEGRIAHWCERCYLWESIEDDARWLVSRPGPLPGYLCPSCYEKDWIGAWAIRNLCAAFCCLG